MRLLRDFVMVARSAPAMLERRFATWSRRQALAPHRPVQVDEYEVWCLRDQVPWPCKEWSRLTGEAA